MIIEKPRAHPAMRTGPLGNSYRASALNQNVSVILQSCLKGGRCLGFVIKNKNLVALRTSQATSSYKHFLAALVADLKLKLVSSTPYLWNLQMDDSGPRAMIKRNMGTEMNNSHVIKPQPAMGTWMVALTTKQWPGPSVTDGTLATRSEANKNCLHLPGPVIQSILQ